MTFFEWCGYDTKLTEGEAIHAEAAWDHQQKIIDNEYRHHLPNEYHDRITSLVGDYFVTC